MWRVGGQGKKWLRPETVVYQDRKVVFVRHGSDFVRCHLIDCAKHTHKQFHTDDKGHKFVSNENATAEMVQKGMS